MDKLDLIGKLLEIDSDRQDHPFEVGKAYFWRTVTYHLLGEVAEIRGPWIILRNACWVADSGRYADAFAKCELNEVEPIPDGSGVRMDTVTDFSPWLGSLPREQR